MEFLKNFFDDDSHIIGLCGFESLKPKYNEAEIRSYFFKVLKPEKQPIFNYETKFTSNVFLSK